MSPTRVIVWVSVSTDRVDLLMPIFMPHPRRPPPPQSPQESARTISPLWMTLPTMTTPPFYRMHPLISNGWCKTAAPATGTPLTASNGSAATHSARGRNKSSFLPVQGLKLRYGSSSPRQQLRERTKVGGRLTLQMETLLAISSGWRLS